MPKRPEDKSAPAEETAVEQEEQTEQTLAVEVDESVAPTSYTEKEMMGMPTKDLEIILSSIYGIDARAIQGTNSNLKFRTLILKEQVKRGGGSQKAPAQIQATALKAISVSTVTYEGALTINTGNFENTKITVGITLPVNPTPQEIADAKETMEIAKSIVLEQLQSDAAEVKKN